jgi:anthranilate synthase component 2
MCDLVDVKRSDEINLEQILDYDKIVLSPGPGLPADAGMMPEVIKKYAGKIPILGVCLGMQGIAEFFGGRLYNQTVVRHGISTTITTTDESVLFHELPRQFEVGLYHSWAVTDLSNSLQVTAMSQEEVVMAIECAGQHVYGVQFHPESILTQFGKEILLNFIQFG